MDNFIKKMIESGYKCDKLNDVEVLVYDNSSTSLNESTNKYNKNGFIVNLSTNRIKMQGNLRLDKAVALCEMISFSTIYEDSKSA